jgi:hypothetical protein
LFLVAVFIAAIEQLIAIPSYVCVEFHNEFVTCLIYVYYITLWQKSKVFCLKRLGEV